jgi:hypothetical protein
LDPVTSAKVDAIAHALAGEKANEDRLTSAADFARAQLGLLRIRSTRTELMEKIELNYITRRSCATMRHHVVALDRYERYSLTIRRRASRNL